MASAAARKARRNKARQKRLRAVRRMLRQRDALPTRINPDLRWYVAWIGSVPGRRARVALRLRLRRLGVATYIPAEREDAMRRGRPTPVEYRPLGRLMFVGLRRAHDLYDLRSVDGIGGIPRIGGYPLRVRASDLQEFASGLARSPEAEPDRDVILPPGVAVKVIDGPFASFPATVIGSSAPGRVRVEVSVFGRLTPAELDLAQVEVA